MTVGLLFFATACFGQTSSADSQTLQALLSEVRQLRQDIQLTTIMVERAQILIYRLHGQEAAVARASQRLDESREKLARTQEQRKQLSIEIKQEEEFIANTENVPAQRKNYEDRLPHLKARVDSLEGDEQQDQAREIETEQQFRAEEAKLNDLRDQLDRLDKTLENAGRKADGGVQ
jgi:chromosome segregation ATPase